MAQVAVTALAGQPASICLPSRQRSSRMVVICHGNGIAWEYATTDTTRSDFDFTPYIPLQEMIYGLAERNYAVVVPALLDTSLSPVANWGSTFGNNASTTLLASVITAAQATVGIKAGKYALMGVSMGNMTAMNHARRAGQTNIAGMLGIVPVCDGEWQYVSNGAKTAMDAAYGAATYQSLYDPKSIASSITVPWHGWTNTADTSAPPSQAVTMAALIPGGLGTTQSRGDGGHDFSGCTSADAYTWLQSLNWGD